MTTQSSIRLHARIDAANPNHHLWLNHGTWWIHYTLELDGERTSRVRRSLGTTDAHEARLVRDRVFADFDLQGGQQ